MEKKAFYSSLKPNANVVLVYFTKFLMQNDLKTLKTKRKYSKEEKKTCFVGETFKHGKQLHFMFFFF